MSGRRRLVEALIPVVRKAGDAILHVRRNGAVTHMKRDGSPVTSADLASHEILRAGCHMLAPAIPVISEEDAPACERDNGIPPVLLVIDPLDGTKEFIEDRNEFAINVALVENGRPTAGLIFAPALGRLLFSYGPRLAFEQTAAGRRHWLPTVSRPRHNPIVLVSRSHRDPQTDAFVAALQPCDVKAIGSSLKFAQVATGEADFYPRLAPTMIWDCAAGQAIVEAAGGAVLRPDGQPLSWTEDTAPRVDGFIAAGTKSLTARLIDVLHAVKA